jgi:hypothetical protein
MEHVMKLSQSMVAAAFGLGLLSAGCIAPSDATEAADMDAPSLDTLTGVQGGNTQNGLTAVSFHAYKDELFTATHVGLFSTAPAVNAAITTTGIFGDMGGVDTFKYAVKCGAPNGTVVTIPWNDPQLVPPTGEGLLATLGTAWTLGGLGDTQRNDVFTCITALMNAYGAEVPILLTGTQVANKGKFTDYTFKEALWVTEAGTAGVTFKVWPLQDLTNKCGTNVSPWLYLRICGDKEENCGVQVRDLAECSPVDGNGEAEGRYNCDGKPAIQTWLPMDSAERLYFNCEPPDPQ